MTFYLAVLLFPFPGYVRRRLLMVRIGNRVEDGSTVQGTSSYQVNRVTFYRGEIRSQIRGSTCQKMRKHLMDLMLIKRNIVMEISPSSGYLEEIKLSFFFVHFLKI